MLESKNIYIRQMVLQYLLCKEPEVKVNIENALVAIFRFDASERDAISTKRLDETASYGDALSLASSFTGIFSSLPKLG